MGWTSVRDYPHETVVNMLALHSSYFKGSTWKSTHPDGSLKREVLVEAMAPGAGGAYGVMKVTDHSTGEVYRTALVVLVERRGGDFYWKDMTEQEGPNACYMPERLFRKLTPLDCFPLDHTWEHARDWRARVQAYLTKKKQVLKPGDILQFPRPLTFRRNKDEVTLFRVEQWGRTKRFMALCTNGHTFLCRLSRNALTEDYVVNP